MVSAPARLISSRSGHTSPVNVRRFDVRFFIRSLIVATVVGGAGFGWYLFQRGRLAGALEQIAQSQLKRGDLPAAQRTVNNLLTIQPNHPQGTLMMATISDRSLRGAGQIPGTIMWYYRTVSHFPNDMALRVRLAELLILINDYEAAREETAVALAADPQNVQAQKWDMLAEVGVFQNKRAGSSEAIRARMASFLAEHPEDLQIARSLAMFLREELAAATGTAIAQEADAIMNTAVEKNADRYESYLARYLYRRRYDLPDAQYDIAKAIELAPRNTDVIHAAAQDAARRRDYKLAARLYQQLTELVPLSPVGFLGLGDAYFRQEDYVSAVQSWTEGDARANRIDLRIALRLAEGYTELSQFELADKHLQQAEQLATATEVVQNTDQRLWARTSLDLLRGKWHLRQRQYRAAVPLLRQSLRATERWSPEQEGAAELAIDALQLLGDAYLLHDHRLLAAETYEQAFARDRSQADRGIVAAEAWANAGRSDKAINLARELVQHPTGRVNGLLLLAQLQLNQQLQRVPIERDWTELLATLAEAERAAPSSWRVQLLKARSELVRRGVDYTGSILQQLLKLEREHADDIDFWPRLVLTYEQLGQASAADRALARYEQLDPTSIAPRLLRAQVLQRRGDLENSDKILQAAERLLAEATGNAPLMNLAPTEESSDEGSPRNRRAVRLEDLRQQLDALRWDLANLRGERPALVELLTELHEHRPTDIRPLIALIEAGLSQTPPSDVAIWQKKLSELEDEDQVYTRYFRARQLLAAETPTDATDELIEQLDRLRPGWSYVAELKAVSLEKRGDLEAAVTSYKESIAQGNDHFQTHTSLLRLLYRLNRFAEAEVYFDLLQGINRPQSDLQGAGASSLAGRNTPRVAPLSLGEFGQDAWGKIWLGQAHVLAGNFTAAREQLVAAWQQQPELPVVWIALASFYARAEGSTPVRQLAAELEKKSPLAEDQRQFVLGYAYELLGDRQRAAEYYEQAHQQAPQTPEYLVRLASCLLARDPQKAQETLQTVLKEHPQHAAARRLLALAISNSSQVPLTDQVRELLPLESDDLTHWRMQAVLLAQKSQLVDAIDLYRQIVSKPKAQPMDWLTLAQLQEQQGDQGAAYETHVALSQLDDVGQQELLASLEFFLSHDQVTDAERVWETLSPMIDDKWLQVSYAAKLADRQGQSTAARDQIETYAADQEKTNLSDEDRQLLFNRVAQYFLEVGEPDRAEAWYRRLAEEYPQQSGHLAMHLANHNQIDQGIQVALRNLEENFSAEAAILLARILLRSPHDWDATVETTAGGGLASLRQRADELLGRARAQFSQDANLAFAVSNWRLKEQRSGDAIELLEATVKLEPSHMLAWNNLAALLAETPDRKEEALDCLNRAIDAAGYAIPTLLDTKGVILLNQGQLEPAIEVLQAAADAGGIHDPRYYFHLAQACDLAGEGVRARAAWQASQQQGITGRYLTQKERQAYIELSRKFDTTGSAAE